MELTKRKQNILASIVDGYIRTGEPVGSKSIAEKAGVSSATVRNEMAELTELGLLEQPHTSAGRIPTYLGYRLYIERLMHPHVLSAKEKREIDEQLTQNGITAENVVDNAVQVLSDLTQLTVVNSNNMPHFSVITRVEVIPAGRRLYALLIITSTGAIKNKICRLEFDLTNEQLGFFAEFVNKNLTGTNIEELTPAMLQNLAIALGSYMISLSPLLYAVYELSEEFTKNSINIRGEQRLLEAGNMNSTEIIRFLNEKQELARLLSNAFSGIKVIFGKENDTFSITNSSMVVSPYKIGEAPGGSLGIIGPLRLDYAKVIPYMQYFSESVTKLLSDILHEEEK